MNRSKSAPPSVAELSCKDPSVAVSKASDQPMRQLSADVPVFHKLCIDSDHFHWTLSSDDTVLSQFGSQFDQMLYAQCSNYLKHIEASGLVVNCNVHKCLKGAYSLVVQLCPERPREKHDFHVFHRVCERFSPHRNNFATLRPTDTLLQLEDRNKAIHSVVMTTKTTNLRPLLLPFMGSKLPQTMTEDALKVSLEVMLLSNCKQFIIGFNSLMAGCEVNQLHFELLSTPYVCKLLQQPVERISSVLYALKDWIIPGFAIQLTQRNIDAFCRQCTMVTNYLGKMNQPFSLLLCRTNGFHSNDKSLLPTAYVFPRQPVLSIHPSRGLRPTAMDMSGVVSIYSIEVFQNIGESQIVRCFRDFVQTDSDTFQRLTNELKKHCDTDTADIRGQKWKRRFQTQTNKTIDRQPDCS